MIVAVSIVAKTRKHQPLYLARQTDQCFIFVVDLPDTRVQHNSFKRFTEHPNTTNRKKKKMLIQLGAVIFCLYIDDTVQCKAAIGVCLSSCDAKES